MEMPKVIECQIGECAYNKDFSCHALAITIGDKFNPKCDTFCSSSMKGGDMSCTAGVGAYKVSSCLFNNDLECCSSRISIGYKDAEPDCLTFQTI